MSAYTSQPFGLHGEDVCPTRDNGLSYTALSVVLHGTFDFPTRRKGGVYTARLLLSLLGVLEAPRGESKASSSMDSGVALYGWRRVSLSIETLLSMDRDAALYR